MGKVEGNIIDILNREIYPGVIHIENGRISNIVRQAIISEYFICPGFIDGHVHIESSMLTPEQFSKLVIQKGTVAVINDPHEIANVMGVPDIRFMLEDSRKAGIHIYFTIPSCVPATSFDVSGASISFSDVQELANTGNFVALSEVMNVHGLLSQDPEMIAKVGIAKQFHLKIDGHAPYLSGMDLKTYVSYGVSTDHECVKLEEAMEKIAVGMKILIREGSAAKNYEALKMLIKTNPDDVMFCTDDSHPDELITSGHIDKIVKKAIDDGFDLFDVLKIASINPIQHYQIPAGTLQVGDSADFIRIRDLKSFEVLSTYIGGIEKYKKGENETRSAPIEDIFNINNFHHDLISGTVLQKKVTNMIRVIKVTDGELITSEISFPIQGSLMNFESDIGEDILKIVYINRYANGRPQIGYIHGFGLKEGAFASTVSHDSHNILAIGCSDKEIESCINAIIKEKGGLVVKNRRGITLLPLPIGGIMTNKSGEETASCYQELHSQLKEMGCHLHSPFMTLSFMALIVIPELKIGEKGLFDFRKFCFIEE